MPTPFEPWTTSKAPEDNPYFKNFYQNSVYQQDLHIAKMIAALKASPAGKNTVIVSHKPNLQDAAGKDFGDLAEGEAVVFKPLGEGKFKPVARVAPATWTKWAK